MELAGDLQASLDMGVLAASIPTLLGCAQALQLISKVQLILPAEAPLLIIKVAAQIAFSGPTALGVVAHVNEAPQPIQAA
jgi:hypothetical protein